jgi:hypothetical protein
MSGIERASGRVTTLSSPFPAEWGTPPGDEQQRARWTRFHAERAKLQAQRRVRTRRGMTGRQALARLLERAP